ncbi:MAG: 30S ribosomal protein S18 [Spirochaetaceae bacterium]|jgi:small subunit ribosomal protein S18|nr:30S ribosomal protein S18 [Spirochaetaceae bacterium]
MSDELNMDTPPEPQPQENLRDGDERMGRPQRNKTFFRKRVCRFCAQKAKIDYKDPDALRRFTTERGKILPRRMTGTCAKHQRRLAAEIKRARAICLLPFVSE